jgi:DNA helicase-2/ATP-dependent DNA helicase PcrA
LFVVGDEDQSIYNFRGADLRNILDFERDFPSAKVVKLEDNYRSTGSILEAAGALIANNQERKGKRLIPQLESGSRPKVYEAEDEVKEAEFVAGLIQAARKDNDSARIAVLYRTNAQSRAFEEEFVSRGIPHLLVGGQRFYERKEIKDALAYLRLLLNPHDNVSFMRVVNVPVRGVGGASIALIQRRAAENNSSLWDAAHELVQDGALPARAQNGLVSFQGMIEKLTSLKEKLPAAELLDKIISKSQLATVFEKESPAVRQSRLENLNQLVAAATDYQIRDQEASLTGFLDGVSLLTDLDQVKADSPCLLMTLHAAKGLEFDSVFLAGLEEGLFPHTLSIGNPRSVEEERRLCYVGMTRARVQLTMTYARSRRAALQQADRSPSRFLDEIPTELLDWKRVRRSSRAEPAPSPRTRGSRYKRGTVVKHPLFGEGTVVEADPSGREEKVTVVFRAAGRKKLVPRFANLEILSAGSRPRSRW